MRLLVLTLQRCDMPILELPTITQSTCIFCNKKNLQTCAITIYYSGGNIQLYLGLSETPTEIPTGTNWELVSGLTSGVKKTHTFTIVGKAVFYKIIKDYDTIIYTTTDANGRKIYPALEINS